MQKKTAYRLKPFKSIIDELVKIYPNFPVLDGLSIIELGPGSNINLLKYLCDNSSVKSILGIGKSQPGFWKKRDSNQNLVIDAFILPALKEIKSLSVDLIYSRHVMEQHSIQAAILLKHPQYRAAIRDNSFDDLSETFPASPKNIQSIFKECHRILKPGGTIISQIAKKKYRVLSPEMFESFDPERFTYRDLGRFSETSIFTKKP